MNIGNKTRYFLLCMLSFSLTCVAARPLRFLFILDKFPWYTKGIIVNQMIGLIQKGHVVDIYARTKKMSESIDASVLEYKLLDRTYYEKLPPQLNMYDVIICQYGGEGKRFVKLKREKNLRCKLITCIRGGDITSKHETLPGVYDELFMHGDAFFPVCEYFKARLVMYGCKPRKIHVLHSAIDCDRFAYQGPQWTPGTTVRLLSVNRLYEEKANDYVIRALGTIKDRCPELHFEYLIVGDGPEKKRLQDLIDELQLQDCVQLVGWRNKEGVVDILKSCHIFVLPSVTAIRGSQEGIPNALKEAMAIGLPVISTFHAGIPELVQDGVSGFLVPEREESSLVEAIEYLLKNPQVWKKMGREGRRKVKKDFEMQKTNKRFFALLEKICGRPL